MTIHCPPRSRPVTTQNDTVQTIFDRWDRLPDDRFDRFVDKGRLGMWLALFWVLCQTGAVHGAMIFLGVQEVAQDGKTLIPVMIQHEVGDPQLAGVQLAMQISDGTVGPKIGAVDLVTGTIFESNHTGSRDKGSLPRQAFWETTTAAGTVPIPATGVLATIEVDTTGLKSGAFVLKLTSVLGASTVLFDGLANPVIPNNGQEIEGTLTVVPEPTGLLMCVGLGIVLWRARMGRSQIV